MSQSCVRNSSSDSDSEVEPEEDLSSMKVILFLILESYFKEKYDRKNNSALTGSTLKIRVEEQRFVHCWEKGRVSFKTSEVLDHK